jgi:serine/threonine-protein kinase
MGVAYLASHPILRIPLVVKLFAQTTDRDIFREAHLAARVTSPYTVPVVDAGFEQDMPYMVQTYVDGLDVQELLTRLNRMQRVLPFPPVIRIMMQASYGLHAIHQAGVLHRDVKPANLFLRGNGVTTVGDFGIATPAAKQPSGVTGTVPFMAPEQLLEEPLDRTTDLYALGITSHLLLTGNLPFDTPMEKIHQPYTPPPAPNPHAAYLFAVIGRMLHRQQSERYPTALTVASELSRIALPARNSIRVADNQFRIEQLGVTLMVGNLAKTRADVLVSASNWSLVMDVGVSKALLNAGGTVIQEEAVAHAPAAMGDVVWTQAGRLKAQFVAHAVAALKGAICIQRCVLRVLLGCEEQQVKTVAFPALGSGAGDVPMELAAQLTLEAIRTFAQLYPRHVEHVMIVLYDQQAYDCWLESIQSL